MKLQFALSTLIVFTLAMAASAQDTAATFDWKVVQQSHQGASNSTVVTTNGKSILQITSTDAGLDTRLLTVTNPPVTKKLYAITGQIKYENVIGDGYLEMWNYFPPSQAGGPEGKFYSRTLAQYGEMKKIEGTSDWRDFILPFNWEGASGPPTRLEVNLVLPGKGKIYIGPLKLAMYEPNQIGALVRGGWTNGIGPSIGVIGGLLLGCVGILLGWLAKAGRARTFVIFGLRTIALIGVLLIIGGLLALVRSQPSSVWLPMLIFGAILASIHFQLPTIQRRYEELELRRMNSLAPFFLTLFLIVGNVIAGTEPSRTAKAAPKPFVVFDNMFYARKPDLSSAGLIRSSVIYPHSDWKTAIAAGQLPDETSFKKAVQIRSVGCPGPIVIDIEYVYLSRTHKTTDAEVKQHFRLFITLAKWAREAAPGHLVGYYGHGLFPEEPGAEYAAETKELIAAVDAFFPSLYTFGNKTPAQWKGKLQLLIAKAHKIAPGKPIYPYLWAQYHEGAPRALEFLDGDYMKFQLETARNCGADGVVMWSSSKPAWNDAPWSQALLKFVAAKPTCNTSAKLDTEN